MSTAPTKPMGNGSLHVSIPSTHTGPKIENFSLEGFKDRMLKKESVPTPTQQAIAPTNQARRNSPFTQQQLNSAWKAAVVHFKSLASTPATAQVMLEDVQVLLGPDAEITVTLKSKLYADALAKIKQELVSFLRNELANDLLDLAGKIDEAMEEVAERIPFTPNEKLKYLMEQYPMMLQLKQKLDLDLE